MVLPSVHIAHVYPGAIVRGDGLVHMPSGIVAIGLIYPRQNAHIDDRAILGEFVPMQSSVLRLR
jgi:hypothetical protein